MSRYPTQQPPWKFLLTASKTSLQSYELSRLACAANLRKEIAALLDQWLEESASAMLARLLIEQRARSPQHAPNALSGNLAGVSGRTAEAAIAPYNIFPDATAPPLSSGAND